MVRLVLFDIDGTLVDAGGAGSSAMLQAGLDVLGEGFTLDGVNFAGNLDRLIFNQACEQSGLAATDEAHEAFRDRYVTLLGPALDAANRFETLPGAQAWFDAVAARADCELGLLTGNYETGAKLKLSRGGLDPAAVALGAYGDDASAREDLVPVAQARFFALNGERVRGPEILVVGDTPRDVACALAHGCQLIAVATGHYDVASLKAAGAERVLERLTELDPEALYT